MPTAGSSSTIRPRAVSSFEEISESTGVPDGAVRVGGPVTPVNARLEEVFSWTGLDIASLQLVLNDVREGNLTLRGPTTQTRRSLFQL